MILLLCILLSFLPVVFHAFTTKRFRGEGSDASYHKLLIEQIRRNNHKPVLTLKNLVNSQKQSYPQLLHWVLSYLPEERVERISKAMPVYLSFFNSVVWIGMILLLRNMAPFRDHELFVLKSTALYISCPYLYSLSNAKNIGLSARGLGVTLGILTIFFTLLFATGFGSLFYILAIVCGLLILLSSQFATQFFVFCFVIWGILTTSASILLLPFCAILLYFVIAPKLAMASFTGQLEHKSLYSRRLADKFIFAFRKSIWNDLTGEIPSRFLAFKNKYGSVYQGLRFSFNDDYIRRNSLVLLLLELLVIVLFVCYATVHVIPSSFIFSGLIWSAILVFTLTTLKPLRFLGEPERYLEFVLPFAAMALAIYGSSYMVILIVLISLFILASTLKKLPARKDEANVNMEILEIKKLLLQPEHTGCKVLPTTTEDAKYLLSCDLMIYFYLVNAEMNDEFSFEEIYPDTYSQIGISVWANLIRRYNLTHVLVNKKSFSDFNADLFAEKNSMAFQSLYTSHQYELIQVKPFTQKL